MKKYLYFSIFGGNLYYAMEDEEKVLDPFQIPLTKSPNTSCKKCYGRFYIGYDNTKRHFLICGKCGKKCIDSEKIMRNRRIQSNNGNR